MATYGVDFRTGVARGGKIKAVSVPSVPPNVLDKVSWSATLADTNTGSATDSGRGVPVTLFNGMTMADDKISKVFRSNGPMAVLMREYIVQAVNGSTNTIFPTYARVSAVAGSNGANLGGNRPIDKTALASNYAYTATVNAALYNIFRRTSHPGAYNQPTAGYIADPSKNGGGRASSGSVFR